MAAIMFWLRSMNGCPRQVGQARRLSAAPVDRVQGLDGQGAPNRAERDPQEAHREATRLRRGAHADLHCADAGAEHPMIPASAAGHRGGLTGFEDHVRCSRKVFFVNSHINVYIQSSIYSCIITLKDCEP